MAKKKIITKVKPVPISSLSSDCKSNTVLEKTFNILTILCVGSFITAILFFFYGCTTSVTTITTRGTATDVVDEEQTAAPNISPNLSIPVKP